MYWVSLYVRQLEKRISHMLYNIEPHLRGWQWRVILPVCVRGLGAQGWRLRWALRVYTAGEKRLLSLRTPHWSWLLRPPIKASGLLPFLYPLFQTEYLVHPIRPKDKPQGQEEAPSSHTLFLTQWSTLSQDDGISPLPSVVTVLPTGMWPLPALWEGPRH